MSPALLPEHAVAAIRVWLADPRCGLLITGDAALRERLVGELAASAHPLLVIHTPELLDPEEAPRVRQASAVLAAAADLAEVPRVVADRCALVVELAHDPERLARWTQPPLPDRPCPRTHDEPISTGRLVALAEEYGVRSAPVEIGAGRVAATAHRLGLPGVEDLVRACVFGPRRTDDPPSATDDQQGSDDHGEDQTRDDGQSSQGSSSDDDSAVSVAAATTPPPRTRRARNAPPGRGGPVVTGTRGRAGRTVSTRRPDTVVALGPTIAHLAELSALRGERVPPTADDVRWQYRRRRSGRLTILVVDASGSMGRQALHRAKGLALAMLDRAYRQRDRVAVVLARGREAQLGLPPTKSMARVRASLRRLPHGGGTPLASALLLAARLATAFDPIAVEVVIMTDGRANIGLAGETGARAREDAVRAAEVLRRAAGQSTVHAMSRTRRRGDDAAWLRAALGAV